jgi:hypothetical protein
VSEEKKTQKTSTKNGKTSKKAQQNRGSNISTIPSHIEKTNNLPTQTNEGSSLFMVEHEWTHRNLQKLKHDANKGVYM